MHFVNSCTAVRYANRTRGRCWSQIQKQKSHVSAIAVGMQPGKNRILSLISMQLLGIDELPLADLGIDELPLADLAGGC